MEDGGELSSAEFGGNRRVQIQNNIYRQVAIKKPRKSISGDDNQECGIKPDDALGNAR